MRKAAAVMAGVFSVGSGAMVLLGNVLGAYAEQAALALVGVGLVAASSALATGARATAPAGIAKEA